MYVISLLPKKEQRQNLLFSATFSDAIQQLARQLLNGGAHDIDAVIEKEGARVERWVCLAITGFTRVPKQDRVDATGPTANPGPLVLHVDDPAFDCQMYEFSFPLVEHDLDA